MLFVTISSGLADDASQHHLMTDLTKDQIVAAICEKQASLENAHGLPGIPTCRECGSLDVYVRVGESPAHYCFRCGAGSALRDSQSGVPHPQGIMTPVAASGSATPVDPPPSFPVEFDAETWIATSPQPEPPKGDPSCRECGGTGEIKLFTSVMPCGCCGGGS